MFDGLSNEDVQRACSELIPCLGVKEDICPDNFLRLLYNRDIKGCVQEIATRLGLPVRIDLSFVPKGFRPNNKGGFHSSALAQTDRTGHSIEGIIAQVSIPQTLPLFGSSSLEGFPIRVQISENCYDHPSTFIAVIAHELSHVLLACLRSPHKDSELHTDLVPILLGFRECTWSGRKTHKRSVCGNTTTTQIRHMGI